MADDLVSGKKRDDGTEGDGLDGLERSSGVDCCIGPHVPWVGGGPPAARGCGPPALRLLMGGGHCTAPITVLYTGPVVY